MKCTHPHWCADWDYMFILPGDAEFECCSCDCCGEVRLDYNFDDNVVGKYERKRYEEWRAKNESGRKI